MNGKPLTLLSVLINPSIKQETDDPLLRLLVPLVTLHLPILG